MQRSTFNLLVFTSAALLALACASQQPSNVSEEDQLRAENSLLRRQLKSAEDDAHQCIDLLKACEADSDSR